MSLRARKPSLGAWLPVQVPLTDLSGQTCSGSPPFNQSLIKDPPCAAVAGTYLPEACGLVEKGWTGEQGDTLGSVKREDEQKVA